ncbi:unnamed protein product, partial [Musa acuminata subsp. burmannicoides]
GPRRFFVRNHRKRWATSDGGNRTAGTAPPRIANRRSSIAFGGSDAVSRAHRDPPSLRWTTCVVVVRNGANGREPKPVHSIRALLPFW